jgi:hypothetical protein
MWTAGGRPEDLCMPPTAAPAQQQPVYLSVRVHRGDHPVELERRLEACLLIARTLAPVVLPHAA